MNTYNHQTSQETGCKIFVGGLTWSTTKEMLITDFSQYGEIVDAIVMKNPETGNSRGFGFITYVDNTAAEQAVNSGSHKIDGKIVDVKLCNPRLAAQQRTNKLRSDNCKVFVGGLPHGVTDDEIKQFFSRYGPVKEFKMMYDENKQRPRGFGFITFDTEESANQVLQEHYIQFNNKQIEVKPQIHNTRQFSGQGGFNQMQQTLHQMNQFAGGNNWSQNGNGGANWAGINAAAQQQSVNGNSSWGNFVGAALNGIATNAGLAQGWGYPNGQQANVTGSAYPYNGSATPQQQANWNSNNYYGGQTQGYYPTTQDASGTGTFNF